MGDAAKLLRPMLPSTIELELELADTGPVRVDRVQAEQVLLNLCINARDAMAGQGEIRLSVAEAAHDAVCTACRQRFAGRRVGLPVSGGNIDSRVLASVLMRGLVRDGRLVRLRVTMPDISGSLAKVAALIAEAGGNIVEVQHQRIFGTSSVRSPEVEFLVETRDRSHTERLVAALQGAGVKTAFF